MRTVIPFTTPSGYSYFYSFYYKQFILSHPLLNYFILLSVHPDRWSRLMVRSRNTNRIRIRSLGTISQAEFNYYLDKYRFYKRQGFFKPGMVRNRNGELLPDRIKQNLTVTKQVIFETTEDCNLDCMYCTYSKFYFNKERVRKKINPDDAINLLKLLLDSRQNNQNQGLTISFYGGEPLRNFAFIEQIVTYVKAFKNEKLKVKFSMSTNGLLLKKYLDFLVDNDFELAISLDGDEFSNSFRVLKSNNKPSFGIVSRNIDMIREKHPDYFKRKVSFLTVRHSRNSLKSINDFFSSRYDKTPVMSAVTTTGLVEEHRREFHETFIRPHLPPAENEGYIHELFTKHPRVSEISETIERFGDFVFRQPRQILKPARNARDPMKYLPTATCSPFDLRIYMSADGGIYPCEHISRIFEIGSIRGSGIDLDNNRISQTYNAYFKKIRKLCSKCYLSEDCKECIFNTGIETDRPKCEFFSDKKKFASHLAGIFDYFEKDNLLFARIRDEAFIGK